MMQLPEKLTNSMRNCEVGVTLQIHRVGAKRLGSLAAIPGGRISATGEDFDLRAGELGNVPQDPLTPYPPTNNEADIILNIYFFSIVHLIQIIQQSDTYFSFQAQLILISDAFSFCPSFNLTGWTKILTLIWTKTSLGVY